MAETRRVSSARPSPARRGTGPRTGTELLVMAVLVLGLTLNALVLLRHTALSRADVLLGATVLVAGVTLLVMMEVYRRR
ncbi:MAG TPA: hypothetical protein VGM86_29625 [Thermoanaerobaculia bacterium]